MSELHDEPIVNEIEQEVQHQQEQVSIPHIPARPTRHSPPAIDSDQSTSTTTSTDHPVIPQRPTSRPTKSQENKIPKQETPQETQELGSSEDESDSSAKQNFEIPVIPTRPLRQQLEEPIIPQRPTKKQDHVEEPIIPQRPTSVRKEESVEPIIPPRPQRTNSQEPVIPIRPESTKSQEHKEVKPISEPVIPSRPKTKSVEPDVPARPNRDHLAEPEVPLRPVSSREEAKEGLDNLIDQLEKDLSETVEPSVHAPIEDEDESPIEPVSSASGLRLPSEVAQQQESETQEETNAIAEGQLNSETVNSLNTFGDGEVTPGNSTTKASFKSDEDEDDEHGNHLATGDSSSFDDDVETISQEQEDHLEEERQQEEEHAAPVVQSVGTAIEEEDQDGGEETDTERAEAPAEEPVREEHDKQESKPAIPVIPSRPPKKASLSRSTTEEDSIGLDQSKPNINKPIIPKRPTTESLKSGDESTSSQKQQPSIPVRPTKSNSSTASGSTETVTKLKPPPPKPKKLSSKIAAFQQQLFNPMKSSSSADEDENKGEGEQPKPRKPVDSSKFLLRFGGNAIPLPGMFNPGQIPMHARPSSTAKDDDDDDAEQGSSRSVENAPVRRTRGPRGKKLPKSVSEAKVETESKFCLESGELFGLVFTKKVEEPVDDLTENEVVPKNVAEVAQKSVEEEVTKVNNKPEVALQNVEEEEEEEEEDDIIDEYEKDEDIVEKDEPKPEIAVPKEDAIESKTAEPVTVPGEFEDDTKEEVEEEEEEEEEEEPVHRIAVSTDSRGSPVEKDGDDIVIDKTVEEKLNSSNSSLVDVKQEMEDALSKNDEML